MITIYVPPLLAVWFVAAAAVFLAYNVTFAKQTTTHYIATLAAIVVLFTPITIVALLFMRELLR